MLPVSAPPELDASELDSSEPDTSEDDPSSIALPPSPQPIPPISNQDHIVDDVRIAIVLPRTLLPRTEPRVADYPAGMVAQPKRSSMLALPASSKPAHVCGHIKTFSGAVTSS
jgi:hypothetical protein